MEKLSAEAKIGIQKPLEQVFEAIVNPDLMKNYFISKGSARLEPGREVFWEFPELEGSFPVKVRQLVPLQSIQLEWDENSYFEINLEEHSPTYTIVRVKEVGYQNDPEGIKWVISQTEGWANFLACLKAYLEYGINLRKGAFDFPF